jgi:sorbose reductase
MGTFFSAQLAAKHMASQETGGSIVMIASVASHCAIPSQRLAMYGASKGAVRILAKHLAVELAPHNIRVNTISPGYIATEMTKALGIEYPELLSVFESAAPIKRMGDRKDLKGIVGYLLTDAAAYTTGADIEVTGGLHAGRI